MTHPLTPREKVEQAVKGAIREDASVGLQMTLTPRFMRGLVDRVLAATSVVDHETGFVSDKSSALASGSGDHAELARLADDLRKFEHHSVGSLKISMDEVRRIIAVCDAHAALLTENAALRAACSKSNDEISQTLGKALGYPWFKDDQINFPGATAENGVCVGDHVAESLADEAARRITEAERKLAEAEETSTRWAIRFAELRKAAGIGVKPMLSDVPGELRKMRSLIDRAAELMQQCTDPERFEGSSTLNVYANMRAWLYDLSKEAERG